MSISGGRTLTRLKAVSCLALASVLFGCGGTGQDKGEAAANPQVVQGLAIDGYVARATVFIDYDNNHTRDPWEPFAFTDDDGYFSYNPLTQTNYCAANAPSSQNLFCLRVNRTLRDAVVRIDGGYDVMTGEPFYGQLSRRVSHQPAGQESPIIISPITSLFTDIRSEAQKNAVLAALNINPSDLDQDYLNLGNSGAVDGNLLSAALTLHKSVSILSQFLQDQYREIGTQTGSMNDVSATIYKHFALQLASGTLTLADLTSSPNQLEQVIARTELEVLEYYDKWELTLPAAGAGNNALSRAAAADRAVGISQLIETALIEADASNNPDAVHGAVKLIEAMTIKAGGNASDRSTFRPSVNHLLDNQNRTLLNELIDSLAEADSDLVALARLNIANSTLDSPDAVRAVTRLPSATNAFRDLAGRQMRVSDMDLGSGPNQLRDAEVEIYFHGNNADTGGNFTACIKYIKDASINGKLGDGNTRGELVKGYWSLLGASNNNGSSYSLLLTIEFLGAKYQAILKPAATATFNAQELTGIRFDYANELRTWYSARGIEAIRSLPQNHAECAARLPSRIGI